MDVNGIQFETLVPERIWNVPKKSLGLKLLSMFKPYYERPAPSIHLQIGLRITNNTPTLLRFNFNNFLVPEVSSIDGLVSVDGYRIRPEVNPESDFPVIETGKNVSFWLDAVIFWHWGNQFGIKIAANNGFLWFIQPLKLGSYRLKFTYMNNNATITMPDVESRETRSIEGFWIGQVSTPPVEIRLVNP